MQSGGKRIRWKGEPHGRRRKKELEAPCAEKHSRKRTERARVAFGADDADTDRRV